MASTITIKKNNLVEQATTASKSNSIGNEKISFLKIISDLTKFRITFFVSVTTVVGYILYSGRFDLGMIFPALGVLILACGASALNEYQERNSDKLMKRTSNRPIPSGNLSASNGLLVALSFIVAGLFILWIQSFLVVSLGLITLVWYNFVYTPMKTKYALAIVPGSLIGALPPIIGYAAAGGDIFNSSILTVASFLFIWQIPHFWLLLLMYDEDYKKGGFPTLTNIFNNAQLSKITYLGIFILVLTSFLLPIFSISVSAMNFLLLGLLGFALIVFSYKIIFQDDKSIYRNTFMFINLYVLAILLLISIDKIIHV